MKIKYYCFLLFFLIFSSSGVLGQGSAAPVEMADTLHENGKIYVVVIVLAVVFAGIIAFLISIDRKVSRLEKKIKERP